MGRPAVSLVIEQSDPRSGYALRLIEASDALSLSLYPPEGHFGVDSESLAETGALFWLAWLDHDAVGCVALVDDGTDGEVKRLFVADSVRGKGVGRALMDTLEGEARRKGLARLLLETGPLNEAAVALYRARGYVERGRFGDYPDNPFSLFMEKRLV